MCLLSTEVQATKRCFEELIGAPDEACYHGPLKSRVSMRQLICDFKLECPEHNRPIEWQEMPDLDNVLTKFSIVDATIEDVVRWQILRAKHFLILGEYNEVELASSQAIANLGANGDQLLLWYALYFRAKALLHEQQYEKADEVFSEILTTSANISDERYRLYSLYALSDLRELQGKHGLALECYREFHRLHQLLSLKDLQIREQRDSVRLAQITDKQKAGSSNWQWAFWTVVMIILSVSTAVYLWPHWSLYLNQTVFARTQTPIQTDKNTRPMLIGIPLATKAQQTDEEILVDDSKIERLVALRNVRILTQDDWESFEQVFCEIYPEFLVRLRFLHPEVTKSEEKLACLLRIHYGTKEVARSLAISPQSVSVTRYRLRKKIGLVNEKTLEEYIMSL
jgi:tetratricopeptide (TPR) repeat protein